MEGQRNKEYVHGAASQEQSLGDLVSARREWLTGH
jgi:hypothetical protein